jgi:poly(hydroxyalkanoate) depolymerase family esterase
MFNHSETAAAKRHLRNRAAASTVDSALVETMDFGPNPGGLKMLSFTPDGLKPHAPLVVVLHGCTQTAEGFARNAGWITLAEQCGFVLLAPEQQPTNNLNRCFRWFKPDDAAREAASIEAMIAHAMRLHRHDAQRVYVTGLSAGGAMTSVLLATYPEVFAAGAIVAGLPFGIADSAASAWSAMSGRRSGSADLAAVVQRASPLATARPRVSIWHGDADVTVHAANADDIALQWVGVHGLTMKDCETETIEGRTRTQWLSSRTGEAVVETNIVHGLGHGMPLATLGDDAIGAVAPHMLEAGVSAAREIARFWGLLNTTARSLPEAEPRVGAGKKARQLTGAVPLGDRVLASLTDHVSADVEAIIAKALKSAGLKR